MSLCDKKLPCGIMNFRKYGQPPYHFVVVHGGPGAPGSASSLARMLTHHFGEIGGVIEAFQTADSVSGQVKELYRQITQNANEPLYVLGHSWGAWLNYLLAYKHPEVVKKLFLISAPAFDVKYLSELQTRRLAALSKEEQAEYFEIIDALRVESPNNDTLLKRLGALAEKADNYCVEDSEENRETLVEVNGSLYQKVWNEAHAMRKRGEFIRMAPMIQCPTVIIHGANDTTPIKGVVEPIKKLVKEFKYFEIEKSGHSPWKEKYGKELFFQILSSEWNRTRSSKK